MCYSNLTVLTSKRWLTYMVEIEARLSCETIKDYYINGLSCVWFWLENPKMITLGNIKDMSADEITKRIIDYRKSKFEEVVAIERTLKANPFGGCGGDAKALLNQYISIEKY